MVWTPPNCEKCHHHPAMVMCGRRKLVRQKSDFANRAARNVQLNMHGHHIMAGIASAVGVGAWVVNQFLEEVDYKCPCCDDIKTVVEGT
jgi:hypothetical protein